MMKKHFYKLLLATVICVPTVHAQLVNNGSNIYIDSGATVSLYHSLSGEQNAQITNNGEFYVTGDITNNAGPDFFDYLSMGTLILNGQDQWIKGNNDLTLYRLSMIDHIKTCEVGLTIEQKLELNNALISADDVNIQIYNNDTDAISRRTGYIVTRDNAQLIRTTYQENTKYVFPLGGLSGYYRPVDIITGNNVKSQYGITLHANNPTFDGFNTSSKVDSIAAVNERYYYTLDCIDAKEDITLQFYTDSQVEKDMMEICTWSTQQSKWTLPYLSSSQDNDYGDGLNRRLIMSHPAFRNTQFNLVTKQIPETPGLSKHIQIPNSFTANNDGLNDFWEIKGIEKFPDNHVTIFNRWGEVIFETKGYSNENHFNASSVMQGVYVYVIEVSDDKGYHKVYNGDLTILR